MGLGRVGVGETELLAAGGRVSLGGLLIPAPIHQRPALDDDDDRRPGHLAPTPTPTPCLLLPSRPLLALAPDDGRSGLSWRRCRLMLAARARGGLCSHARPLVRPPNPTRWTDLDDRASVPRSPASSRAAFGRPSRATAAPHAAQRGTKQADGASASSRLGRARPQTHRSAADCPSSPSLPLLAFVVFDHAPNLVSPPRHALGTRRPLSLSRYPLPGPPLLPNSSSSSRTARRSTATSARATTL